MLDSPEALSSWLKARRRQNNLQLNLMSTMFDLEGALDAGQLGLAWVSQEALLTTGCTLHALQRGLSVPEGSDEVEVTVAALEVLAAVDAAAADKAWQLWLRPAPGLGELAAEVARTVGFLSSELGLPAATRAQAIQAWADGVDTMRRVAAVIGLAQSDDWYLPSGSSPEGQGWYESVRASLAKDEDA
ncbi:hypothetical protein [Jatrophihabitans sp.]|uniref:hypothetical protein n=1 Tax=Jatrophihabitans sp. TaxID=1932789 RepID=UPI002B6F8F3D|nr:hypothetical protein [Jatrophihabitans sp.]